MIARKHSPAPWTPMKARQVESSSWLCMVQAEPMAAAKALGMTRERAEANAQLIAAAPETITMLEDFADVVEANLVHGNVNLVLWIAKARMQVATALKDDAERQYQAALIDRAFAAATTPI